MVVTGGARHTAPSLRLTRRGRAVLLGLFFGLVSLASIVLFVTASQG
jgi:hypothetical protein